MVSAARLALWLRQVPIAGPIEPVHGPAAGCQNCVNVEVAPPAAGDDPRQIVEGYLRATSNYQPNYSVAKQFLTEGCGGELEPRGRGLDLPGLTRLRTAQR